MAILAVTTTGHDTRRLAYGLGLRQSLNLLMAIQNLTPIIHKARAVILEEVCCHCERRASYANVMVQTSV